jgi:hypothetical protein
MLHGPTQYIAQQITGLDEEKCGTPMLALSGEWNESSSGNKLYSVHAIFKIQQIQVSLKYQEVMYTQSGRMI